jgi:phosphotransferase system, enzyme I, PtsP
MKRDNLELICSIGDLAGLFKEKTNVEGFLQQVVHMIADHLEAEACSIYIRRQADGFLELAANVGLAQEFIGTFTLAPEEGITGKALSELKPLRIPRMSESPYYKFVPGMQEEQYEAFLAVPIVQGLDKVGVIVLEHSKPDYFTPEDTRAVQAIASQLAATIENARLLLEIKNNRTEEKAKEPETVPDFIRCKIVASGVAIGAPVVLGAGREELLLSLDPLHQFGKMTMAHFSDMMKRTEEELKNIQLTMEENLSEVGALIFSSHMLMLQDEGFSGKMVEKIKAGVDPAVSIVDVVNSYIEIFLKSANVHIQEKIHDIRDLGHRMLRNLESKEMPEGDYSGQVILARDMLPSDLIKLSVQHAEGFILYGVSAAAHIAILARSLNIPVVITNSPVFLKLKEAESIVIDANQGNVYINPSGKIRASFEDHIRIAKEAGEPDTAPPVPAATADGVRISVLANINLLSDVRQALHFNAEGIGLYRSEFPFLIRNTFPTEDEQYQVYSKLYESMGVESEIILRTLDVGGDKTVRYIAEQPESNPFLGLRAIRYSLKNKDIFSAQVRAMLRAAYGHRCKIMFPLISSLDDFLEAKDFVFECAAVLDAEGLRHNGAPKLGAMVELPSAVEQIDELAEEADFLSIGTNDLVQYLLGIDRTNELVSHLYTLYHPAVLRTIERVIRACTKQQCEISVCGDAAKDIPILTFMIGIGLRKISVEPRALPPVKQAIGNMNLEEITVLSRRILKLKTVSQVRRELEKQY